MLKKLTSQLPCGLVAACVVLAFVLLELGRDSLEVLQHNYEGPPGVHGIRGCLTHVYLASVWPCECRMPGVSAARELLRGLWQALGVVPALQRVLCCGSLAQVIGASPCFLCISLDLAWFWLLAWKFEIGSFFCCGKGRLVVLMAVERGCLCDGQAPR